MKLAVFSLLNAVLGTMLGSVVNARLGLHGAASLLCYALTGITVAVGGGLCYPAAGREDVVLAALARRWQRFRQR